MGNWKGEADQFIARGSFDPAATTPASGPVKIELTKPAGYILANGAGWEMEKSGFVKPVVMRLGTEIFGTVLMQVLPDEKLKFERFPGKKAVEISGFTAAAQIFER